MVIATPFLYFREMSQPYHLHKGIRMRRKRLRLVSVLVWSVFICLFSLHLGSAEVGASSAAQSQGMVPLADPTAQSNEQARTSSQDRVASLLAEGEKSEAAGRNAEALAAYQAAALIAASNPQLYLKMGLLRGKAGDFENARRAFQRAIELQPNLAEAHYDLGLTLVGESRQVPAWKEALREFEIVLALRPGYPEALNMSGVCLLESGNPAEAATRFRAALQDKTDSAAMHFNLGRALEATGHPNEALDEYTTAANRKSPYPEAEIAIGNLLLAREEYLPAVEHFRKALSANPDIREAHYELAQALRRAGDPREAQVELKQAAALIQKQSDAIMSSHLSNESLDHAKAGDLPGALQVAKKALWLDPENAIADYNFGLLLADAGKFESSILELRKAISLTPLNPSFYVSLAKVEEKARNPRAALEAFERARQLNPGDRDLQETKAELDALEASAPPGKSLNETKMEFPFGALSDTADGHLLFATQLSKEGDFLGSVGELLRASNLHPERSDLRYNVAVARAELGQLDQAELDFRKALLQSPSNTEARVALGSVLFAEKDYGSAASEFRHVLEVEPGNQEAARLLAKCPASPNP